MMTDMGGLLFKETSRAETRLCPEVLVFFLPQSDLLGSRPHGLKQAFIAIACSV